MVVLWLISLVCLVFLIIFVAVCSLALKRLANEQLYYEREDLFEKLDINEDLELVSSHKILYKPVHHQLYFKKENEYKTLDCVRLIDQFSFSYQRNISIIVFSLMPIILTLSFLNKIITVLMLTSGIFPHFLLKDILVMTVVTGIYMLFLWKHYKNSIKNSEITIGLRYVFLLLFYLRLLVPMIFMAISFFLYTTGRLANY